MIVAEPRKPSLFHACFIGATLATVLLTVWSDICLCSANLEAKATTVNTEEKFAVTFNLMPVEKPHLTQN